MQFFDSELASQLRLREDGGFPEAGLSEGRYGLRVLPGHFWKENLHPLIREEAIAYFQAPSRAIKGTITWHKMRGHLLSSQIACINFLMPFATRPMTLASLLQPLYPGKKLSVLPIQDEGAAGEERFVAFEWVGRGSHLNEDRAGAPLTRGANCTSTDAMVLLSVDGRTEMLLIEWKYTEKYGAPLPNPRRIGPDGQESCANDERRRRYAGKLFAPDGPLKPNSKFTFDDLLWEPFYQLARQQMLAHQLERAREEGAQRVRVLHLAPSENRALERVTSPRLRELFPDQNAFQLWSGLLVHPDRFIKRTIGDLFRSAPTDVGLVAWHSDMSGRYAGALR